MTVNVQCVFLKGRIATFVVVSGLGTTAVKESVEYIDKAQNEQKRKEEEARKKEEEQKRGGK